MHIRSFRTLSLWLLIASFGLLVGCDAKTTTSSVSKPQIVIQSPFAGSQFREGDEIAVQSTSTDSTGVVRIELMVDGVTLRTDAPPSGQSQPSFTLVQKWKATTGSHTISVRAYNAAGTASDPAIIVITVAQASAGIAPTPAVPLSIATTTLFQPTAPAPTTAVQLPTAATTLAQPTATVTGIPTSTATATATPSSTATATLPQPTATPTVTFTPSRTPSPTPTPPGRDPSRALITYDVDTVILHNSRTWYRFEYRGDRTPISVAMNGFGTRDLEMLIYTPEQVDTRVTEPRGAPVGRGGGNKAQTGHDVFWTGASPLGGTYYIAIVNQTDRAILYRLSVSGPAVTAGVMEAPTGPEIGSGNQAPYTPKIRVETSPYKPTIPANFDMVPDWKELAQRLPPLTIYYIFFPPELGIQPMPVSVPLPPEKCTPPEAVGVIITQSIKLCPNSTYYNLNLAGKSVGIFGDSAGTAVVKADGRSFAVTAVGESLLLQGLKIQSSTDPNDLGKWLCAYEKCGDGPQAYPGSTVYGGGILLKASGSIVKDVTVTGGTTGIATLDSADNYIVNNRFMYQTGWASYNRYAVRTHFLGNAFNYSNRSCVGPDRKFYQNGCETAGWLCISCRDIFLVDNECRRSGNCYYANGDGGVPSFNVKFFRNTCFGAPNNCFEATYSRGIYFEKNVAAKDLQTGQNCNYPFWVGGSEVIFGRDNNWACTVGASVALKRSENSVENQGGSSDDKSGK